MKESAKLPRATLGRLPAYLHYLRALLSKPGETISAAQIARDLGYGEVQVRKDLAAVSGGGKPKVGYVAADLQAQIEQTLGLNTVSRAVLVGAGKLGMALFGYGGFSAYGLEIAAAFDTDPAKVGATESGKPVYGMDALEDFCRREDIRIGILTVPQAAAQATCERMLACGITAIWSFSPEKLTVPAGILLRQENLALSLAHLNKQLHAQRGEINP